MVHPEETLKQRRAYDCRVVGGTTKDTAYPKKERGKSSLFFVLQNRRNYFLPKISVGQIVVTA
jgi:hypothetical protein